jgi:hypothetical protein
MDYLLVLALFDGANSKLMLFYAKNDFQIYTPAEIQYEIATVNSNFGNPIDNLI